ncbi:hypothetical protein ANAPH1_00154 [Anaplasma phagocytophilum]|nr:hypothetical protein ANAPH1_00154 [Anaplasma phagocytophilum]
MPAITTITAENSTPLSSAVLVASAHSLMRAIFIEHLPKRNVMAAMITVFINNTCAVTPSTLQTDNADLFLRCRKKSQSNPKHAGSINKYDVLYKYISSTKSAPQSLLSLTLS